MAVEFVFPLVWSDIGRICQNPNIICQELRSDEVCETYRRERHNNKSFLSSLKTNLDTHTHLFMDSKYAYNVKTPILHRILWLKNMTQSSRWVEPYDQTKIIALIETDMKSLGFDEYLMFQNPPEYRSVAAHPHYHLFYNKKEPNPIESHIEPPIKNEPSNQPEAKNEIKDVSIKSEVKDKTPYKLEAKDESTNKPEITDQTPNKLETKDESTNKLDIKDS